MVEDGVIWCLSKLALMENRELMCLCAKALCRLSVHFARPMITSNVTVRAVLSFLSKEDMSLKKPGARILTNLLLETTNEQDEQFRKVMVEHMHLIASTGDEELNELCVVCLCLASQSEVCRIAIVRREMINKIQASAIFSTDSMISFAYITMISNIASNEEMRSRILDNNLIGKFKRILENPDAMLNIAVIKALYCVNV
jgi:hypothetical protein